MRMRSRSLTSNRNMSFSKKQKIQAHTVVKNSNTEPKVNSQVGFKNPLITGATHVITLNSYPNGVSISLHKTLTENGTNEENVFAANLNDPFFLRTRDTREIGLPEGRFLIYRENFKVELENLFANLNKKNILGSSAIFFGVTSDPFHSFHQKFAQTAACLEILEKYKFARVIVQSRSKMLLSALPTLKILQDRLHCVIPFESRLEKAIMRYTPGQPKLEERLITANGLKAQNIKVTFSCSPILPYGETSGDTWKFAELLVKYSDKILLQGLCTGTKENESIIKKMSISLKLEADKHVLFLRPNAEEAVKKVLEKISPAHLAIQPIESKSNEQLKLFAA